MDRTSAHRKGPGFTLLELLIALFIAALSLTLAIPLLRSLVVDNTLEVESKRLLGALNLARSEAVLRNLPVALCPSSMAGDGEARCAGSYTDGWLVYADVRGNARLDEGEDPVLEVFRGLPPGFAVSDRGGTRRVTGRIEYRPDGTAGRNLTLQLCPPRAGVEPLSIVLNIVGRARLERGWGTCSGGA